jgi:hypothetical protein
MGKYLSIAAGMLWVAAFLFVQPSKADSFNAYTLTGSGTDITFSIPQTFRPATVEWNGVIDIYNVTGTFDGGTYTFNRVQLGPVGYNNYTNYWAFGGGTKSIQIAAPGLFTWNSDGTVTLNAAVFQLGTYETWTGGALTYTLSVVDPPGDGPVGAPEPASLILLGVGGLAAGTLRRRKAA